MTLDFTAFCSRKFRGLRRLRLPHAGALASGAITAMALCTVSLTATAYQYDLRAPAVAPDAVDIVTNGGAWNPSPGCGKLKPRIGTFTMTTTDGANRTRSFLIEVPAIYNPNNGYSLNFVYHGAGGNSAEAYAWGLQNVTGANESGIFVYPQGINYQNYGIGWDDTTKGYDIPFFDNMVKVVEADWCVNTKRIFAAGFSWGGDFVTALTCNRGAVVRAVAVNSATDEYNNQSDYRTYANLPCASATHSAMRYVHAVGGDSAYPSPLFGTTSSLYRSFNTCAATSTASHSSTSVMTCVTHNSCSKEFIECSFNANIGHTLPPNWASDTWAFFQTFP
jgi:poly(3-hydroxybutyrate) depolymerase